MEDNLYVRIKLDNISNFAILLSDNYSGGVKTPSELSLHLSLL